jgi:FtsH-binding integral membrane protein
MQQEMTSSFGKVRADAIYTDAMSRLYGLVALGIVTTGAAIFIGDRVGVGQLIVGFGWLGYLAAFGVMIGTLIAAGKVVAGGNTGLGTVLYLTFTGLEGLFLSPILMAFTTEMIGLAFMLTAGLFVAMSAVGMTTKRDLSKLGPMLFIGLIGMIVISLINVLLIRSDGLFLLISLLLLPLFLALTVWETKQVKGLAQEAAMAGDAQAANQVAVLGSIGLYLNALNIFLILLSLLGFASDD